jgi:hypothetical protein
MFCISILNNIKHYFEMDKLNNSAFKERIILRLKEKKAKYDPNQS